MTTSERLFLAQLKALWPVLDPLPACVLAVSFRERLLFANRTARRMLGPEPERQPLEQSFATGAVTLDSGRALLPEHLGVDRALGGETVEAREVKLRVRGTLAVFRVNAAPIFGPDARALGVIVLLTDVTALAANEARARLLARLGPSLAPAEGPARIAARAAELVMEGLGSPCAIYLCCTGSSELEPSGHGEPSPPLRTAAERAIAGRKTYWNGELLAAPMLGDDKVLGAIALSGGPGPQDGALIEQVAVQTALAVENARLLAEIRDACDAKDQVLAVTSHEMCSPLSALGAYVELLLRGLEKPDAGRESLERAAHGIRSTTDRLLGLSRRLVDSERIRHGNFVVERHRADLLPTLRDAVARAALFHRRAIDFESRSHALVGRWDLVRTEEMIQNLLANAVRYSAPSTPVRVVAEAQGDEALVSVEDCGIGIPEADRGIVFEAFRRGSNALREGPGLGLGLYLVAEIVRAHEGRIAFGTQLGRGTVFRVFLPLEGAYNAHA